MNQLTLALAILLTSSAAYAQTCTFPTCGSMTQAPVRCATNLRNDFKDANGKWCDMCHPFTQQCSLPGGYDDCVSDCRDCQDGDGHPWSPDGVYACSTCNRGLDDPTCDLCATCRQWPQAMTVAGCDAFYCGSMDARHCKFQECWACW